MKPKTRIKCRPCHGIGWLYEIDKPGVSRCPACRGRGTIQRPRRPEHNKVDVCENCHHTRHWHLRGLGRCLATERGCSCNQFRYSIQHPSKRPSRAVPQPPKMKLPKIPPMGPLVGTRAQQRATSKARLHLHLKEAVTGRHPNQHNGLAAHKEKKESAAGIGGLSRSPAKVAATRENIKKTIATWMKNRFARRAGLLPPVKPRSCHSLTGKRRMRRIVTPCPPPAPTPPYHLSSGPTTPLCGNPQEGRDATVTPTTGISVSSQPGSPYPPQFLQAL
jgi:hypothetical protein